MPFLYGLIMTLVLPGGRCCSSLSSLVSLGCSGGKLGSVPIIIVKFILNNNYEDINNMIIHKINFQEF